MFAMRRLAAIPLALVPVACDKAMTTEPPMPSPTAAATRTPVPTPTPAPMPQIDRVLWRGTGDGLCHLDPWRPDVSASFVQHERSITGHFSDGAIGQCSVTGDFSGALTGNRLSGTIRVLPGSGSVRVDGSVDGMQMVLHVSNPDSITVNGIPLPWGLGATVTLHR